MVKPGKCLERYGLQDFFQLREYNSLAKGIGGDLSENVGLTRLPRKLAERHAVRGGSFGVKQKQKNLSARDGDFEVLGSGEILC